MSDRPARTIRWAAILFFLSLGVAITTPPVLVSYARNGTLPEAPFGLGFRLLAGPFENLGEKAFIALGVTLTVVSLLDAVAGVMLWRGRLTGGVLGLVTSAIVFALGIGFAVPFLLVSTVLRVALLLAGWSSLGAHPATESSHSS